MPVSTRAHTSALNEHDSIALGISLGKDSISSMEMIEGHVQNPLHRGRIVRCRLKFSENSDVQTQVNKNR